MAINVSHIQFREPDFVGMVDLVINDCQVAAEQIELELTESVAMEHIDSITSKLAEIRRLGLSIAVDDFGTGYTSLGILKQLNIDRLKIDCTFIHELDQSNDAGNIAKLIVALGHQFNLATIAEGIETEEQRKLLQEMGCQEGQGYLFSRPLPMDQLESWMADQQGIVA
jgi:EAL domain-containing protein (putative c-di-GMP-specific phosphodiesterase class I)